MGNGDRFVYVTFIRTTPERLWDALTKPEFTRKYWFGSSLDSTWGPGASWQLKTPDGGLTDSGTVVKIDKPRRLVLSWKHERFPEMRDDENARAIFELEPQGDIVKLTVYLTDLGNFALVNESMAAYFSPPYPARAAVGVASLPRGALVEMDAIMHLE